MGNVSDKLPDSSSTSSSMSSSGSASPLGSSPGEASVWFDAPESLNSPTPSVVVALKVVNGEVQAFWKGGPNIESITKGPPPPFRTPAPTKLPELESRSPTSRFRTSSKFSPKKRALISRLSPYEKQLFLKKGEAEGGEREEQFGNEEQDSMPREDEKREKEENSEDKTNEIEKKEEDDVDSGTLPEEAGSSLPPTTLSATPDVLSDIPSKILLESGESPPTDDAAAVATSSNLTDADMKRQKKRERKKARQLNKEQQLERERLQRTEAIKNREERIEREKRELAEREAAVAKTTEAAAKEESTLQHEGDVFVKGTDEEHDQQNTDTISSAASSSSPESSHIRSFSSSSDSSEQTIKEAPEDSTLVYDPEESELPVSKEELDQEDTDGKDTINQEEIVEDEAINMKETFEVCVDGERKRLQEFTPRSKQNSVSQPVEESHTPIFGIIEHEPVVVPFNERPIIANYSFQQLPPPHMPPVFRPGPPPPFPNPSAMPPVMNQFVAVQPPPRFIVQQAYVQPPPPPPPAQFRPIGLVTVPMPMQGPPMHGVPIQGMPIVNHRPMFIPPQGPGMPVQHKLMRPPIHQMPASQAPPPQQQSTTVYASTRQLARPVRNPLPITAPPEKESSSKNNSSGAKKDTKVEDAIQQQNMTDDNKKEESSVPTAEPPVVVDEKVSMKEPVNEHSEVSSATVLVEETIILEQTVDMQVEEPSSLIELRRSSSIDFNGDLITSGVAAVLDESDEEFPPIQSTSSNSHRPLSPTSLAQLEAINRVFDFSKQSENTTFDIWSGWMTELPSASTPQEFDINLKNMLLEDEKEAFVEKKVVSSGANKIDSEERLTLMSICKFMEPYFMNSRAYWAGSTLDGDQLRDIFTEAYAGSIPSSHWRILEKVCCFEQGYFHVFDVLIGSILELTYKFFLAPEGKREKCNDELYKLYQSLPPVDGVENFFKRFEEKIMPDVLYFLSNRYISVRAFVAIAEVVKEGDLSVSDLYYFATLVYGARQFISKFNSRIKQLHIIEAGGKRWIRQTTMDEPRSSGSSRSLISTSRMVGVPDFVSRLRPHIDDILELLPDAVVNDVEFFKAAKLVCGWSGDHEERIWQSIINDRSKFQDFYDAYRPFLRIEIRMGTIYLRKLTYDNDYETETDEKPMKVVAVPFHKSLNSSIKMDDNGKEKKKAVSYATHLNLVAPNAPAEGQSHGSTQTDHIDMDQIWDLERKVIRQLKRDNLLFAEFIESDDAREMHQFLIDTFKNMDLRYFAFILEKAMAETHEKSWQETVELRKAAEEARLLLEETREQHKKEFGELRSRMETISRFEAYEVHVASKSRIDGLQERINQLNKDRELLLREEVKEERARLQRQLREMKQDHKDEKRQYLNEIARLREENYRLLADRQELEVLKSERIEMAARCESQMNKAEEMCKTSTRLLQDSQREIEALRGRNQIIETTIERPSIYPTPDPEWASDIELEEFPDVLEFVDSSTPSTSTRASPVSPIQLSSEASLQYKMLEKYAAEFHNLELRVSARELVEWYKTTKANHKERKTAEKQLKEYETTLDLIENAIRENLEMLKLNVIDGLLVIPDVPMPFSEKVMQKMLEYRGDESNNVGSVDQMTDEEDGCLICTELVEATCETVTCDTCSKEYHYHCISQWLKINSVCPACSRTLKDPNEYPRLE